MERKLPRAAQSTTKADLRRIKKGNRLEHHPWEPPTALNNEMLNDLEGEPRIWLSHAVDLMAFGGAQIPKPPLEVALRRLQASRALCDAARTNPLKFIGNPFAHGDKSDPIPQAYFDMPRCLGDEDDTLITDLDKLIKARGMDDFVAARDGNHQSWFNVRIETKPFQGWIRGLLPIADKSAKNTNCKHWLIEQMKTHKDAKPQSKRAYKTDAMNKFDISGRAFDKVWADAIDASGASVWAKPGAPKKK